MQQPAAAGGDYGKDLRKWTARIRLRDHCRDPTDNVVS
jgi:hypothetical protein